MCHSEHTFLGAERERLENHTSAFHYPNLGVAWVTPTHISLAELVWGLEKYIFDKYYCLYQISQKKTLAVSVFLALEKLLMYGFVQKLNVIGLFPEWDLKAF